MQAICEVVITAPNEGWLREFTRKLVEERLAACGQIVPAIHSIYQWEGRIHSDPESRVMLHTRQSLVPKIIKMVRIEHPYEVPCVLATLITHANPDYRSWVLAETVDAEE